MLKFLLSISYKGIFYSSNGYSWRRKKKEWLELISRPLYQELEGDFRPESVRLRFRLFAIRQRSFLLMAAVMLLREWEKG